MIYYTLLLILKIFPPKKWLSDYMRKYGGKIILEDRTVLAHQSEEFNEWCYNEGYELFKKRNV